MALIFPRIANNFIKNGYYPTDEKTLEGILAALDTTGGDVRVLDPCCGCGTALSFVAQHLQDAGATVQSLGIEFDSERAWHAKQSLGRVIHADVNDVSLSARSVGLLFLNPPYGHALKDDAKNGERSGTDRLEKQFFRKTLPWLAVGGIMVLIVPYAVLDKEFAQMIARQFTDVRAFKAPETQFRQCVVFGRRKRGESLSEDTVKLLLGVGRSTDTETAVLDPTTAPGPYLVPTAGVSESFHFTSIRIDGPQLADEVTRMRSSSLWPSLPTLFGAAAAPDRRPLRALSDWHLALALAAGQLNGVVRSALGRTFLIKGDTHKEKSKKVEAQVDDAGTVQYIQTLTDKFVPSIRAINFTETEPSFGEVFTIR